MLKYIEWYTPKNVKNELRFHQQRFFRKKNLNNKQPTTEIATAISTQPTTIKIVLTIFITTGVSFAKL